MLVPLFFFVVLGVSGGQIEVEGQDGIVNTSGQFGFFDLTLEPFDFIAPALDIPIDQISFLLFGERGGEWADIGVSDLLFEIGDAGFCNGDVHGVMLRFCVLQFRCLLWKLF